MSIYQISQSLCNNVLYYYTSTYIFANCKQFFQSSEETSTERDSVSLCNISVSVVLFLALVLRYIYICKYDARLNSRILTEPFLLLLTTQTEYTLFGIYRTTIYDNFWINMSSYIKSKISNTVLVNGLNLSRASMLF